MIGASTLKPEVIEGLDIMIVRELTGGVYFGEPRGIDDAARRHAPRRQHPGLYDRARSAASPASPSSSRASAASRLCSVEKANVMESGVLWREEVQKLHDAEFPDVELSHMYADNCAMQLVRNPKQFDVIVTDNLFGDILSDCAAMLTGSLGMLPSASLGAADKSGRRKALYEPVHGSAPDIAGKDAANPARLDPLARDDAALFLRPRGRGEAARSRGGGGARERRAHRRHHAAGHEARLDHRRWATPCCASSTAARD